MSKNMDKLKFLKEGVDELLEREQIAGDLLTLYYVTGEEDYLEEGFNQFEIS